MTYVLGIDLGGTKIAAGIVDHEGVVLCQQQCATPHTGAEAILAAVITLCHSVQALRPDCRPTAIGMGSGGQIDARTGHVLAASDLLPGWAGTDIRSPLANTFGVPCAVDNDVNALACGETRFGAARGADLAAFVALGTGVGGAIVYRGQLLRGSTSTAGEFGHLQLSLDGSAPLDDGGRRGTLEAYASGGALLRTWRHLSSDSNPNMTGKDIGDMALAGDMLAIRSVEQVGEALGWGLASIANILDPNIIVVGGGLVLLGDILLQPARRILAAHALPGPARCAVVPAQLGADAGIVGAAALALEGTCA